MKTDPHKEKEMLETRPMPGRPGDFSFAACREAAAKAAARKGEATVADLLRQTRDRGEAARAARQTAVETAATRKCATAARNAALIARVAA